MQKVRAFLGNFWWGKSRPATETPSPVDAIVRLLKERPYKWTRTKNDRSDQVFGSGPSRRRRT
jgi:hypothetical protein